MLELCIGSTEDSDIKFLTLSDELRLSLNPKRFDKQKDNQQEEEAPKEEQKLDASQEDKSAAEESGGGSQ